MPRRALYLAQMMRNERQSPARNLTEQNRRLRRLVRGAARSVPFYQRLYADHGVNVAKFRGIEDLAAVPIVDKELLREAGRGAESSDASADLVTISTSGSSGVIFQFRIDRDFDAWRKAQYLRPYLTNGRRWTDRVLRLTAFPGSRSPWFNRIGLMRETLISCAADPAEVTEHWQRLKPDVLQGYPSSLRVLARYCLESGVPLRPAPRRVFTDSELLTTGTRQLLERTWGTAVVDVFGTFETDNIAYQCERGGGYHIALDCVVVEVLRAGLPVPAGESGELVVTVLHNHASPLIRYNLRDIVALDVAPCTCGRTLPLLRVIEGRADDQVRLPNGLRRSAQGLLGRLELLGNLLQEYQVEQTSIVDFEVRVVPAAAFDHDAERLIEQIVRTEVQGAQVRVVPVPVIARLPSGKLKHFVSRLRDS